MEGGDTINLLREDEYVDDPKEALTGGENLVGHKINLKFFPCWERASGV